MCKVQEVVLYNRLDQKECCVQLDILVSHNGADWHTVFTKRDDTHFGGADSQPLHVVLPKPVMARFVRVQALGHTVLHLDQVEVIGTPGSMRSRNGFFEKLIYKTTRFLNPGRSE